jgi:hypothetical protein
MKLRVEAGRELAASDLTPQGYTMHPRKTNAIVCTV